MRLTLNLASRPYIELRPLYQRLRVLALLLLVTAALFWWVLRTEKGKAAEAQARAGALQTSIRDAQMERQQSENAMRQPQNAAVLTQAQFLNNLYLHKSFSWTAVMMDLENVLPSGVQVLNIDPVIAKDGKVTIRLRVSGAHDRGVDLVRNLEHSHRFLAPRLARETAESNQNGRQIEQVSAASNVNFDLLAEYNPLPDAAEKPAAARQKATKQAKPAGKTARTPLHKRKAATT